MDEFLTTLERVLKILLPIIVPILSALIVAIKVLYSSNKELKKENKKLNEEKTTILNKYIADLKDIITRYTNVIKDLQEIVETSFDLEKQNATILRDMELAVKLLEQQNKTLDRNTESIPVALINMKAQLEKINNEKIKDDIKVLTEKIDNINSLIRGNNGQ